MLQYRHAPASDRLGVFLKMLGDLRSFRSLEPVFDVTALRVPAVFGRGGEGSAPHHRRSVEWLGENVPGASVFTIDGAQHGAHLSHPDHFAAMTARASQDLDGAAVAIHPDVITRAQIGRPSECVHDAGNLEFSGDHRRVAQRTADVDHQRARKKHDR